MAREITCGIFLIDSRNKCLITHPTGSNSSSWSIPKGKLEPGETELDAAVRELKEETSIDLTEYGLFITQVRRLPEVPYGKRNKTLIPFVIWMSITMEGVSLCCESLVDDDFPEIDEFKWVDYRESVNILHPTQAAVVQHIESFYRYF